MTILYHTTKSVFLSMQFPDKPSNLKTTNISSYMLSRAYTAKFKPCTKNSNKGCTTYTAIAREITKYSNVLLRRLNFAVYRVLYARCMPPSPMGSLYALDAYDDLKIMYAWH